MSRERVANLTHGLTALCAVTLFILYFLSWWSVSVTVSFMRVEASTSGWSGWGIVGGLLLVALLVVELVRVFGRERKSIEAVVAVLATAVFAFTVIAVFTGQAHIRGEVASVETGDPRWTAYAAVVVSFLMAIAAIVDARTETHARGELPKFLTPTHA